MTHSQGFGDAAPAPQLANDPVTRLTLSQDHGTPMQPDSDNDWDMPGVTIETNTQDGHVNDISAQLQQTSPTPRQKRRSLSAARSGQSASVQTKRDRGKQRIPS